jgi:hypothetical protein
VDLKIFFFVFRQKIILFPILGGTSGAPPGTAHDEVASYIDAYADVQLELVDKDFPHQYTNGWGFLSNVVSMGHSSTSP